MTNEVERRGSMLTARLSGLIFAVFACGACSQGATHFYIANSAKSDRTVSVVDHASRSQIARIDVGGIPHGSAPSPFGDRVYVTLEDTGEVVAIDTRSHDIVWRAEITPNPDTTKPATYLNEPSLTPDGRYLWAPDLLGERLVVVDTQLGKMVHQLSMVDPRDGTGLETLHNTYLAGDGRSLFATSIFPQKIARVDVDERSISKMYDLSGQPRPAAVRHDATKMYVQFSQLHGFIELDLVTGEETARVEWPEPRESPDDFTKCHGIGIRPDQAQIWAASNIEGAIYAYSLPELQQLARIPVGPMPNWVAFTPEGRFAYVTTQGDGEKQGKVSVIDTSTFEIASTISVGEKPKRIHEVHVPR